MSHQYSIYNFSCRNSTKSRSEVTVETVVSLVKSLAVAERTRECAMLRAVENFAVTQSLEVMRIYTLE